MSDPSLNPRSAPRRRWPGVLLSIFVPGFGLVRAGYIIRGVIWFFLIYVTGGVVVFLYIWRGVPLWGVLVGLAAHLACFFVMLVDSFREGKLHKPLWAIFAALWIAPIFIPLEPAYFAHAFRVPTTGMQPTLMGGSQGKGDLVIVDRLSYIFSSPKRGDIVVFSTKNIAAIHGDYYYDKRLVGLPGEKIEIRNEHLFADGRQLTEADGIPAIKYMIPSTQDSMMTPGVYTVPKNGYFVLGDNSVNSADSRYWGSVPTSDIYGRVCRIYYPFSRANVKLQ